ncbi:MAG: helix-turn-helix domain-containing protein [Streptosporangiaceae bacterium]
MPAARQLDPSASPSAFFGAELRHYRTKAGLSQEQLAAKVNYSAALVGSVETADRRPQLDLARRCDDALGTDGALIRLMVMVRRESLPPPFRPWLEVEQEARILRSWELAVVPGLLQTETYARELLRSQPGATEERVEELVATRLERQAILSRDEPPLMWFVVDEGVLNRPVGGAEVMRDQLLALLEVSRHTHVAVQVLPSSAGAHPGVDGAFVIASFDGSPDVVYLGAVREGQLNDRPEDVTAITNIYDAIRAEALPARASLDLITKVMEQWT